jgi:alpha-1,6-mannosyltransferase
MPSECARGARNESYKLSQGSLAIKEHPPFQKPPVFSFPQPAFLILDSEFSVLRCYSGGVLSRLAPVLFAGTALELIWIATYPLQPLRNNSEAFIALMLAAFAICVFCYLTVPMPNRLTTLAVLGFGLAFRLTLLPAHPDQSEDIYRYLWDARVAAHGIDPYAYAPSSPELAPLSHTAIYPPVNSKPHRTAYPPLSQMLFRVSYTLFGERVTPLKAIFSLLEFLSIIIAWRLLTAFGRSPEPLYLMAWNPFFIFEFSHSGHSDSAMMFLTLLAAYLLVRGRRSAAMLSCTGAVLSKLHPAFWFPLFIRRAGLKAGAIGAAAGLVLLSLFFTPASLLSYAKSLQAYLKIFEFNASTYYLVVFAGRMFRQNWSQSAGPALAIVFLVLTIVIWWKFPLRDERDLLHAVFWIAAADLCLATTVHPWYLSWAALSLFLFPYAFMTYWTGAVFLTYFAYAYRPVYEPAWVLLVEYLPVYGLMFWEIRRGGPLLGRMSLRHRQPAEEHLAEISGSR